jgi:hypothetical protein
MREFLALFFRNPRSSSNILGESASYHYLEVARKFVLYLRVASLRSARASSRVFFLFANLADFHTSHLANLRLLGHPIVRRSTTSGAKILKCSDANSEWCKRFQ